MNRIDDPENGIAFARGGLALGVALSIAGNIANVVLTPEWRGISIPGAIAWPVAMFFAIEIMVRNRHRKHFTGYLARLLLMSVSVTTFITSFVNLSGFMTKTHEPWIATITGPVTIDVLMLGSTLMLLAASMRDAVVNTPAALRFQYARPIGPMPMPKAITVPLETFDPIAEIAPVSAPPARTRAPRAQWDAAQVIDLALDGAKAKEANEKTGIGISTYGRYLNLAKALKANPAQDIDAAARKVPAEQVEMMRRKVMR